MTDQLFVTAVGPDGKKRRVPAHYLDNPALGYKLPPSTRGKATPAASKETVTEPAKPETSKEG